MRRLRIVIAGAGLGGLYAAAALARSGAEVVVLERAEQLGEAGAGIQISPNGARMLAQIGALRQVEESGFQPEAAEMRLGVSGATILHLPLGHAAEARWGAPYLQAHRADLLTALEDAARREGAEIRLGAPVASMTAEGVVALEDGAVFEADLAIGADGVRSAALRSLFNVGAPRFTGQVAWRGVVPTERLPRGLVHPTATVWVGEGRHVVTYYLRRGTLVNFVAVEERDVWAEESWSTEGDLGEMRAAFAGWRQGVTGVLDAADKCLLWGLYDHPPLPSYAVGRAALIGDAAHPMLPFMAQGAVQSFEDGAALADALAKTETVEQALARYDAVRRPRAQRVQRVAHDNAKLFHLRNPIERAARYGFMAAGARLAPSIAMGRLDWLYGHHETA